MAEKNYKVRAAHCNWRASEEEIYRTLRRITDPLHWSWEKLEKANRIVIKFNMMKLHNRIIYYMGRRRELVDDMVARAVLRLLRERTRAEIIATDTNPYTREHLMGEDFNYAHILKEYDVGFVDSTAPPFKQYDVPGGGQKKDQGMWLKLVDPEETEGERFETYEACLGMTG